ncbi:hypothetical protein [Abiotrophia defectiva]|uniref:hypothetical protein n=1 Tax=Abiotrophia defectiva TaxID=46125 RepID=UPI0028D1A1AA|nr:hypothetical protein [Abiotrophia defectiva]
MQGEDGSVVVFDGEVRLNPQQKQRFLSGLIIIPGGCVIWAIWIMLLLEMMMKVEKQSSAIMILMIALFSVIPIMWLGNRLQRKILHRHLRIIDWGQDVSFIVGKKEQRFDWQDLEDMRIEHFYDRFGEISSIKLELFFQGDGYYYIDAWGQASQELSYFAQGLLKFLDQSGDLFYYCYSLAPVSRPRRHGNVIGLSGVLFLGRQGPILPSHLLYLDACESRLGQEIQLEP